MIPKKTREFFVSLMEAMEEGTPVIYERESDRYSGIFCEKIINRYIEEGVVELVEEVDGVVTIILNGRDDFISGFARGVQEAKNGNDLLYADYNANPFAFSIGYEHYKKVSGKKGVPAGYVCHGFELDGSIHTQ